MEDRQGPSSVSSIKVQIFRKEVTHNASPEDPMSEASGSEATQHSSDSGSGNRDAGGGDATAEDTNITPTISDLGVAQRDPDFIKYPTWQYLNRRIDSEVIPPPFEIG
jgi:hypothetical protein